MSYQEYLSYKNTKKELQEKRIAISKEYDEAIKRGASEEEIKSISLRYKGIQDMVDKDFRF